MHVAEQPKIDLAVRARVAIYALAAAGGGELREPRAGSWWAVGRRAGVGSL